MTEDISSESPVRNLGILCRTRTRKCISLLEKRTQTYNNRGEKGVTKKLVDPYSFSFLRNRQRKNFVKNCLKSRRNRVP